MALPMLRAVVLPEHLIADKACDVQSPRDWLKSRKAIATIPTAATRTIPYKHSRITIRMPAGRFRSRGRRRLALMFGDVRLRKRTHRLNPHRIRGNFPDSIN